jgi:hypothetical protein
VYGDLRTFANLSSCCLGIGCAVEGGDVNVFLDCGVFFSFCFLAFLAVKRKNENK